MELNLRDAPSALPVLSGGISIDNMSWWFWIKAGMGATIGFIAVGVLFTILWFALLATIGSAMLLSHIR